MTQNTFLLQRVQPAMVGLIDGSLSTLAPIFGIAFYTHEPHAAFVAGGGGVARRGGREGVFRGAPGPRRSARAREAIRARGGHRRRGLHRPHPPYPPVPDPALRDRGR